MSPLLNTANAVRLGTQTVDAIYLGDTAVWRYSARFNPSLLAGLTIWLDASQTAAANPWTNLAGANPVVAGTPVPALVPNVLNGLPIIRLAANEGRYRFTGTGVTRDYTLAYVARMRGPFAGRVCTAAYPDGGNLLYGFWNGYQDVAYAGGFFVPNTQVAVTTDWKFYSADATPSLARLFSNGVFLGQYPPSDGFGGYFNVSGYGSSTEETCDCDVAEVVLYNRQLADAERQQVEGYLHDKWAKPPLDLDTAAYLAATGLDSSYAPALDGLVVGLKSKGLWAKMNAVYPIIGGTAALHKWNLRNPLDTDGAYRLTFSAGGTHSGPLGYRANAQGGFINGDYADTHLTPSSALGDVNSTHLAFYSLAEVPDGDRCEMGCYNWAGAGSRFHLICNYAGDFFYFGMSEDGATNVPMSYSSGLFVTTRTAADLTTAYRNGVSVGSSASPTTSGLPTVSVWLGGIDTYRGRTDLPCGFASIGSGLTAQNVADLYTVVQAFQTALSRQVSP